ncbi:MAG: hypothetical protein KGM24_15385, partial [Elusimicrobia bacterium]|nr:hypothetical protein [Elusimicrobiota bacterium]
RAQAEADAAAAADARRQAELRYAALTGRGPDEVPSFDGVSPADFDALLAQVSASMSRADRIGALIARERDDLKAAAPGFNVVDWLPWIENLTLTVGTQLPDILSSQALGGSLSVTIPVYDPSSGRTNAAYRLQSRAAILEMASRLRETRLRAHGERLAAQAWAERAREDSDQQDALARELATGIVQFRNGLIQASDLRARARRWQDAVGGALEARVNADLQGAWASLDSAQNPESAPEASRAEPTSLSDAFDKAETSSPDWEALARRSQAAQELLAAADHRVREADVQVSVGADLTATGVALIPAFGLTGLGAWPILEMKLAPDELRQLDVARRGAEAGLYSKLRDKVAADSDLDLTRGAIDAAELGREIALYQDKILPGLEAAQDGSAAAALKLADARAALADLASRRRQAVLAMNQLLGRPLDAPLSFSSDPQVALAAFSMRVAARDPVAAERDALESRVKIAQAVEAEVDKNLKVDQLRLEPISLIGQALGRLVSALSGDAVGSPELVAAARAQTLDAQRALEAFDASLPAARARLTAELSALRARRAELAGRTDAASLLEAVELEREELLTGAQLRALGGDTQAASAGSLPSSFAGLEDRLRQAEEAAQQPTPAGGDPGALAPQPAVGLQGTLRVWDARETLGGDPIGKTFVEGWVEARLRSPSTPPEALAALARLRQDAADERRRLDTASADASAELLLSRLRLDAGLLRWSEGVGLGDSARARASADLAEAAALLRLPPDVKPESLLALLPSDGPGDLASVAQRALDDAESLDMKALRQTLFVSGLPPEMSAGDEGLPQLRADLISQRMSSRGFTPLAAFGLFRGQWVSGGFLQAPDPDAIQSALTEVLDDALRRELESQDRLKALGLLLHSLMASVSDETRVVSADRLREILARRELQGTLERVRAGMAPVSEAAAAMAEVEASQQAFVAAVFALKEDFSRLTTQLTAIGLKPASYRDGGVAQAAPDPGPLARTPRERLLAYWADRMQDPAFAARVEALLAGQPGTALAQLESLAAGYRTAARDEAAVRDRDWTPAERLDLLTKIDLQGRRESLEAVLGGVLDRLQGSDPGRRPQWTQLMTFLQDDVAAQAKAAQGGLAQDDAVVGAIRGELRSALKAPPELAARLRALDALRARA